MSATLFRLPYIGSALKDFSKLKMITLPAYALILPPYLVNVIGDGALQVPPHVFVRGPSPLPFQELFPSSFENFRLVGDGCKGVRRPEYYGLDDEREFLAELGFYLGPQFV